MSPVVRFAPSPTGKLHVGNIRIAIANWLFAKKNGGTFILRMDDTDMERSTVEFEKQIIHDLSWLGLTHDLFYRQSDRLGHYDLAIEKLKQSGRLYPCYETKDELEMKRKIQLSRGDAPRYDRAALQLTDAQKEAYEQQGRSPHWRLKLLDQKVGWNDLIHKDIVFEGAQLSDPVLVREDATPIYTLSSVVDDLEMNVTHVIRGDDHIANTAVQIQLVEALGYGTDTFSYAHMPLLTMLDGSGLSKRLGSLSIESLRNEGIIPQAINSLLSTLGTSSSIKLSASLEQMTQNFNIECVNKSSAKFNQDDLRNLNTQALHQLLWPDASSYLGCHNINIDEHFWLLVRDNVASLDDLHYWINCVKSDIETVSQPDESDFLQNALSILPEQPWDDDTWVVWTTNLKHLSERKGKALYMPLRLALTGQEHGPEMKKIMSLLGYDKCKQRLMQTIDLNEAQSL